MEDARYKEGPFGEGEVCDEREGVGSKSYFEHS